VAVQVGLSDEVSTQVLAGALTEGEPLIIGIANSQTRPGFFGIRLGF
jgi:HlyD family secretion protein